MGHEKPKAEMMVIGGVVRVDEIVATLVVISLDDRVQFCSGYVHGGSIGDEPPVYAQEACFLHAIRAYREWMSRCDQSGLRWTEMRVGGLLLNHRMREWMRVGRCAFESSAASGLVAEIQALPTWLTVDTYVRAFSPGARLAAGDGEEIEEPQSELFVRLAEHFRSVIIPQQGEGWRHSLPRVPLTMEEIKAILVERENGDERRALDRLATKGSTSACIIKYLDLTRDLIKEAFEVLRGKRRPQVGLARILGAARYKVLTRGKVYHVKCPKKQCFERDSFWHMIKCYGLEESVATGVDSVSFLVKMARVTLIPEGTTLIPYLVEYNPPMQEAEGGSGEMEVEG